MNLLFVIGALPGYMGSAALYACDPEFPAPLGFIWFRKPGENLVELSYVFVHEDFRRKGVATAMLRELVKKFPKHDIIAGKANEMSTPWAIKNGCVQSKYGWILKND